MMAFLETRGVGRRALLGALVAAVLGGVLFAAPAAADEIVVRDPQTCEAKRLRVYEITSETWSEVRYREQAKRSEKSVATIDVIDVVRSSKEREAQILAQGIADLERGNYRDAAVAFQNVAGGGYRLDPGTGTRVYREFAAGDPSGRNRRPPWTSEYAHYYYVRALLAQAHEKKDPKLFDEVLMALEDRELEPLPPAPGEKGKPEKRSTGGFLARFADGNSRFYPDAMRMHAEALVGIGDYTKAAEAYTALGAAAAKVPLGPQWFYEAEIGPGVIALAQGDENAAQSAFTKAANQMADKLGRDPNACNQAEYGRLYSKARMRVAHSMLEAADKRGAATAYAALRTYIEEGNPETLRRKFPGLQGAARDALVAGARDPAVQAVALNGTGMAFLKEKRYEDALIAFKQVTVKYFTDQEQSARAYAHLAEAADEAAKAAKRQKKAEVAKMYEEIKETALRTLRTRYKGSRWASR